MVVFSLRFYQIEKICKKTNFFHFWVAKMKKMWYKIMRARIVNRYHFPLVMGRHIRIKPLKKVFFPILRRVLCFSQ